MLKVSSNHSSWLGEYAGADIFKTLFGVILVCLAIILHLPQSKGNVSKVIHVYGLHTFTYPTVSFYCFLNEVPPVPLTQFYFITKCLLITWGCPKCRDKLGTRGHFNGSRSMVTIIVLMNIPISWLSSSAAVVGMGQNSNNATCVDGGVQVHR